VNSLVIMTVTKDIFVYEVISLNSLVIMNRT
jgi:hypothetical protein